MHAKPTRADNHGPLGRRELSVIQSIHAQHGFTWICAMAAFAVSFVIAVQPELRSVADITESIRTPEYSLSPYTTRHTPGVSRRASRASHPTSQADPEEDRESGAIWSYVGLSGPRNWSRLSKKFRTCRHGDEQSPVNITTRRVKSRKNLRIRYKPTSLHLVDTGHTVQGKVEPGSQLWIDDEVYTLVQFHYHTPSENRVNGKTYPLELHFVHRNESGKTAVLAVFAQVGPENREVARLRAHIPHSHEEKVLSELKVELSGLLPDSAEYYGFHGSLTTPPCTEGVRWLVLKDSISMSLDQISYFEHLHGDNARPVQRRRLPLMRVAKHSAPPKRISGRKKRLAMRKSSASERRGR